MKSTTLVVGIVMVCLMALVLAVRVAGPVNRASSNRSVHGRVLLWKEGLGLFEKHWLTGVGVGSLELHITVPTTGGAETADTESEPKNLVLFWLDEMGLSGGLFLIAFIVLIAKVLQNKTSTLTLGISAAWIVLLVASLVDTPFGTAGRYYGNAVVGSLLGATLMCSGQSLKSHRKDTSRDLVIAAP
jgi:O-antigen ligase